jgi:phytoene synthase
LSERSGATFGLAPKPVSEVLLSFSGSFKLIEANRIVDYPVSEIWNQADWGRVEAATLHAARRSAWPAVTVAARRVLRTYSTSFFLVTRFLPAAKRREVEVVYAAVRYPDEIVDTFPLTSAQRRDSIDAWGLDYENALICSTLEDALSRGCNPFAAAFADVVRRRDIPPVHYRSFLEAMRLDICPRKYLTLDDLIDSYIYGSAIVVGYFLAYIYGPSRPSAWDRALASARNLGIALQLTNFLRDVGEDRRRGRVYLPSDLLAAEGIDEVDVHNPAQAAALARVLRRVAGIAEEYYSLSAADVDAFAPDSRVAIQACIDVYRRLNLRIGRSEQGAQHRESVPMAEKFGALPPSKYWRVPLAFAGVL